MTEKIPATLDKFSVPIDAVSPVKGNPRRGNIEAIAESLDRNGQYRPIVVNKRTQSILAGNHTYAAAKRLGWKRIAVTFVDVDEDDAARIVLADNRTADLGDYDEPALLKILRRFDADGLVGTGYDIDFANDLHLELEDTFKPSDEPAFSLDDKKWTTCPNCEHVFEPEVRGKP